MMHGHEKSDLVIVAMKPANKAKKAPCGGVCGGGRSGVGGAKGGGQGEYAPAKHVLDSEPGVACQRRWSVYGDLCRYPPEAGAVCGKAARTDLGGGRAMKRTSLPLPRREFITLVGGAAAAWPLAARAQQPAMPVVGFLSMESPGQFMHIVNAFRRGLSGTGYVEHRNVGIDYSWAEGRPDRLPALATELVSRQVTVIAATGGPQSARAAKAASATIPIVFVVGSDPVREGLVTSLNRPGGNLTGVMLFIEELVAKRLELLRELIPQARVIGVLFNPNSPTAEHQMSEAQGAARTLGLELHVVRASSELDFEPPLRRSSGSGSRPYWSRPVRSSITDA